jgi:hypothetical protein
MRILVTNFKRSLALLLSACHLSKGSEEKAKKTLTCSADLRYPTALFALAAPSQRSGMALGSLRDYVTFCR